MKCRARKRVGTARVVVGVGILKKKKNEYGLTKVIFGERHKSSKEVSIGISGGRT